MIKSKSLFLLGSPNFDGIGLIHEEVLKRDIGNVDFIDSISLGAYPTIQNFNFLSMMLWKCIRRSQFKNSIKSRINDWYNLPLFPYILNQPEKCILSDEIVNGLVIEIIRDDLTASGIEPKNHTRIIDKRYSKVKRQILFLIYFFINKMKIEKYQEVLVFNGRNPVAKILKELSAIYSYRFLMIEYWGSRESSQTYLSANFDLFDLDQRSNFILNKFCCEVGEKKIADARLAIEERIIKRLDPLMKTWKVQEKFNDQNNIKKDRRVISFFFSSEDEYPAFKASKYGFENPTGQYDIFLELSNDLIVLQGIIGIDIYVKLHPRYVIEKKLSKAFHCWSNAFQGCREKGLQFTVLLPNDDPYPIINNSDVVFAFGTIAIEATILGVPSVCLGPNPFNTHGCTHFARNCSEILAYIRNPPKPLSIESAYPYMWAWRELGDVPASFKKIDSKSGFFIKKFAFFKNRFIKIKE